MDHYFLSGGGGGGGLPFSGLADNFLRVMRFKQFFSLHFCNEDNFLMIIFKKHNRLFLDLVWKKALPVHAYT